MATPYLSEIKLVSFQFAPKGWALCNGQVLPINQNQALFALLGTTYGGDGRTTFALPNLQGRVPMHMNNGYVLGEIGGESAHSLTAAEMPTHTHLANYAGAADQSAPTGHLWAPDPNGNVTFTNSPPTSVLNGGAIASAGGGQPHDNMAPYLVLNFIIALQGIFPSQS